MQEDTPEEVEAAKKMWLNEKITSHEKENEMRMRIQQMEERFAFQERAAMETSERCGGLEAAIAKIAEHITQHIERQEHFNKSANS